MRGSRDIWMGYLTLVGVILGVILTASLLYENHTQSHRTHLQGNRVQSLLVVAV